MLFYNFQRYQKQTKIDFTIIWSLDPGQALEVARVPENGQKYHTCNKQSVKANGHRIGRSFEI
jgi:hypothetical protein